MKEDEPDLEPDELTPLLGEEVERPFIPDEPSVELDRREQRNVILRHAAGYLHQVEIDRRRERDGVPGWSNIVGRLKHWLAERKIEYYTSIAFDEQQWKKTLAHYIEREHQAQIKIQERGGGLEYPGNIRPLVRERAELSEIAKWREVFLYGNEALKLIKEARTEPPEVRRVEIERELDRFYALLMRIAHAESLEIEETRDEAVKFKKIERKRGESSQDFHKRRRRLPQRIKDVR